MHTFIARFRDNLNKYHDNKLIISDQPLLGKYTMQILLENKSLPYFKNRSSTLNNVMSLNANPLLTEALTQVGVRL